MKWLALILTLILAQSAEAKPWYKDIKVWAAIAATTAITYEQSVQTDKCRLRAGIENCYGGYGPRNSLRTLAIGSQAAGLGLGLWMRHEDEKAWIAPIAITNTVWGISAIRQAGRTCDKALVNGQCE